MKDEDFKIGEFIQPDSKYICQWVNSRHLLSLISGDDAGGLNYALLRQWIHLSRRAFVLTNPGSELPLAFCTLSNLESEGMPGSSLEICHLIVDPHHRSEGIGTYFLDRVIKIALLDAVHDIYWRVHPSNTVALAWCGPPLSLEITPPADWMDQTCRLSKKGILV